MYLTQEGIYSIHRFERAEDVNRGDLRPPIFAPVLVQVRNFDSTTQTSVRHFPVIGMLLVAMY